MPTADEKKKAKAKAGTSVDESPYRDDEDGSGEALARQITEAKGDAGKINEIYYRDNYRIRLANRELRQRIDELQEETADAVILKGDDKAKWEALSKLEGDPKAIAAAIEKGKKAEAELIELQEEKKDGEASEALGWNKKVLSNLRKGKLALEMRDEQVEEEGKKVTKSVPYARPANDDKAQWKPLDELVEADKDLREFMPALVAGKGESSGGKEGSSGQKWVRNQSRDTGKPGGTGYDPVAAGKKMAEEAKAKADTKDLAWK